jgi:hypothetical protein
MMATDRIGSVIWEAIPFSFVIDWFTDVGKQLAEMLDSATKNFPDGQILPSTVCHSFKLRAQFALTYVYEPTLGLIQEENLGKVNYTRYQRLPDLPQGGRVTFDLGAINPNRGTLTAALVSQKHKRYRTRKPKIKTFH